MGSRSFSSPFPSPLDMQLCTNFPSLFNFLSKLRLCLCVCVFVYLLIKSLVHLTPLKTIVISTKDGCPTLLANDGYFGQAYTLFYFYSCLFCKFKLIKGANKVVVGNEMSTSAEV